MMTMLTTVLTAVVLAQAGPVAQDTVEIAYDCGTHGNWWCSDRDSFGAAVRFTPAEYPCEVLGARAEINYDDGQQIYLRVYDDDGPGEKPGTILRNEQRLDIPHRTVPGFRDYLLAAPVRIDAGDFHICFWQKNIWDMIFGTDVGFDSTSRQLWWFPDQGWVTPYGVGLGDHMIRALVRYGTGVEEELRARAGAELSISPNPCRTGRVRLTAAGGLPPAGVRLYDAAGQSVPAPVARVGASALEVDVSRLPAGVYLVEAGFRARLVVAR